MFSKKKTKEPVKKAVTKKAPVKKVAEKKPVPKVEEKAAKLTDKQVDAIQIQPAKPVAPVINKPRLPAILFQLRK